MDNEKSNLSYWNSDVNIDFKNVNREINSIEYLKNEAEVLDNANSKEVKINRTYKDSLFKSLARYPYCTRMIISEYLCIPFDEVDYSKVKDISLTETIFDDMYNDICFQYDDKMIIMVEHQSKVDYNIPLRMLMYYSDTMKNIYGSDIHKVYKLKIPKPKLVILYKGDRKWKKDCIKLSDMFKDDNVNYESSIDVTIPIVISDTEDSIDNNTFKYFFSYFLDKLYNAYKENSNDSYSKFRFDILCKYPWIEDFMKQYQRMELFSMVKFEDIFIRERLIAKEEGIEETRYTFIKEMYNVYIAYTENPNVWDFLNKYKNLNFTNEEIELINSWDFNVC